MCAQSQHVMCTVHISVATGVISCNMGAVNGLLDTVVFTLLIGPSSRKLLSPLKFHLPLAQ